MKRWHDEVKVCRRNYIAYGNMVGGFGGICNRYCGQLGRFRKRDAYDCGGSRCLICHLEKIFGILSRQSVRSLDRFYDGLNDL